MLDIVITRPQHEYGLITLLALHANMHSGVIQRLASDTFIETVQHLVI